MPWGKGFLILSALSGKGWRCCTLLVQFSLFYFCIPRVLHFLNLPAFWEIIFNGMIIFIGFIYKAMQILIYSFIFTFLIFYLFVGPPPVALLQLGHLLSHSSFEVEDLCAAESQIIGMAADQPFYGAKLYLHQAVIDPRNKFCRCICRKLNHSLPQCEMI